MNPIVAQLQGLYPDLAPGTADRLNAMMPVDPSWTGGPSAPAPAPAPVQFDPSVAHSAPTPPPSVFNQQYTTPDGSPLPPMGAPTGPMPGPSAPMETMQDEAPPVSVTTPAHWAGSTREFGRESGMSPDDAAAYGSQRHTAQDERELGLKAKLSNDAVLSRAGEVTGLPIAVEDIKHTMEMRRQQREAEREKYIQDNAAKVEQTVAEANRQVDPDDIWKGNTFGRVLAAIAVGLGQFGASLTHTENGAAKIIDGAIRNSIDAQKSNRDSARQRLGDLRMAKGDHLAQLDDDGTRDIANHLLLIDQAKQMTLNWAKNMGYDETAPQVHDLLAKLNDQRADVTKDIATVAGGKWHEKETQKFKEAQTTGGAPSPVKREGNLVTTADGTTYHFGDDKIAQDATKRIQGFGDVNTIISEGLKLRKEAMKLDAITDRTKFNAAVAELKRLDDALGVADSTANGQGTVTAADTERRKAVGLSLTAGLGEDVTYAGLNLKNAHKILGSSFDATNEALEKFQKSNESRQTNYVQTAGGELYRRDYAKDKDGNLVPTGHYTGQDAKQQQQLSTGKSIDGKDHANVAGRSAYETVPNAPVQKGTYRAPAASKKK